MSPTDIVAYYCIGHYFNSTRPPLAPSLDFFGPHLVNLSVKNEYGIAVQLRMLFTVFWGAVL